MKKVLKFIIVMLSIFLFQNSVVNAKPVNKAFEDDEFYKCVINAYKDENRETVDVTVDLPDSELEKIHNLQCDETYNITSTKGLEKITNLEYLYIHNANTKTIDLSKNLNLEQLVIFNSSLSNLDLTKNSNLLYLYIGKSNLNSLDLSKNLKLSEIIITNTSLTTLNLGDNKELIALMVANSKLTSIDLTKNTNLEGLMIINSNLKEIDLSNNLLLEIIGLYNNNLKELDLSKNNNLYFLNVKNNELLSLDLNKLTKPLKHLDDDDLDDDTYEILGITKDAYKTNLTNQKREITIYKKNGVYELNLKEYDKNLDPSKVVFKDKDNVKYDSEKGIFTFTELPKSISYIYKTGLSSESMINEDMGVTIILKDGEIKEVPNKKEEKDKNTTTNTKEKYEDQKADPVQTGGIAIGLLSLSGLILGTIYNYKLKNKNKINNI